MIMIANALVLSLVAQVSVPVASIAIDGRFDDWAAISPVVVDPADAPGAFVDIGEVRLAADDDFLYLLIDFGRTVNAQGLDGTLDIVVNADGDETTGRTVHGVVGADLLIRCTPPNEQRPDRPGRGMSIVSTTYTHDPTDPTRPAVNAYDVGLVFGPTHSSRRTEFRIERGEPSKVVPAEALPPLFAGKSISAKVVFHALDGTLVDETEIFTCVLPALTTGSYSVSLDQRQPADPLLRNPETALRLISWNAELGAIISRPEPYVRTLRALNPDVILLQELTNKITPEQLQTVFQQLDGGAANWSIVIGSGGGDLRSAIISRLPVERIESLELVTYPDRPDRSLRVASAVIRSGERRMLAMSIHLKCCGRHESAEDFTRLAEVELIRGTLRDAMRGHAFDGVVIAGDFNLVGSREPLESLMVGLDIDASNLEIVDAYQIDGRSNATWFDRSQPFMPGRLDWALYSDSALGVDRCFVYESSNFAPIWHATHGTQSDDSAAASDHLPVVFDLSWR